MLNHNFLEDLAKETIGIFGNNAKLKTDEHLKGRHFQDVASGTDLLNDTMLQD